MAKDPELDRLKAEQDRTFQVRQRIYDAMKSAEKRRTSAHRILDHAYEARTQAREPWVAAKRDYDMVRQSNGPRIDSLNSQQEDAYMQMKDAFDRASSAYEARDGASARAYADDGQRHKQVSQDCVAERRRLVQQIRDARDRKDGLWPAFERAKAAHERAEQAFQARLAIVKGQNKQRREDKRLVAERAGVPYRSTRTCGCPRSLTARTTSTSVVLANRTDQGMATTSWIRVGM